ncbi:hypothetical protein ABVT39_006672 [Epinephelus coioides]
MLCDLKQSTSKAPNLFETFSLMCFRSAWFPTAGWSTGVQFQVARLFPEREEASSDFPPRNERERGATLPLCDNASSTKVNKACCVSVTKGGLGGQAVDDCHSCVTTQCPE